MKKLIFTIAGIAIIYLKAISQPSLTELSEIQRDDHKMEITRVFANDETGVYVAAYNPKEKKDGDYLEKYDKNGKRIYSVKTQGEIYKAILNKNILYLFTDNTNHKDKTKQISCTQVNTADGKMSAPTTIESFETQKLEWFPAGFNLIETQGGEKLLFVMDFKQIIKGANMYDKIRLATFSFPELKKISEKDYTQRDVGRILDMESDGKLISVKNDSVLKFNPQNEKIEIIKVELGNDKVITSSDYKKRDDGTYLVAGIFSDKKTTDGNWTNNKTGFFSVIIDLKTNKLNNVSTNYFTDELNKKLTYGDAKNEKDKKIGIQGPAGKKIVVEQIIESDKSTYIVAQDNLEMQTLSGNSVQTYFYNKEFVVCKLDENGKALWMKVIPKLHVAAGDNKEYQIVTLKNSIYFMFLEHEENASIDVNNYNFDDLKTHQYKSGGNSACVTITENGTMSKSIFLKQSSDLSFRNQSNVMLDSKTLMIYLNGKEKEKFATLAF